MHESPQSPALRGFIAAFGIVAILKFYFASELDLYSDEIFYWLASTDLSLAYSDLPFMTALMAGMGSAITPGSAILSLSSRCRLLSCIFQARTKAVAQSTRLPSNSDLKSGPDSNNLVQPQQPTQQRQLLPSGPPPLGIPGLGSTTCFQTSRPSHTTTLFLLCNHPTCSVSTRSKR